MNWSSSFLIFCFAILSSCSGVNYSLSGISIPPDVKTVSIQVFDNQALLVNPLLSQVYAEKLKDKFIRQTSLKVIQQEGDWRFSGAITNYEVSPVDRQTISGGTRNKLTITIKVNFENAKNEKENFEQIFTRFQDFDASKTFNTLESDLVDQITDILVQDVFSKTALKW